MGASLCGRATAPLLAPHWRLAEYLAREGNEITVVDISASRLSDLTARLDIRTVEGKVSHPSVLRKAGCDEADLLIAVTDSDELNMLACEVANTLFNASTKIARVRDNDYLAHDELFSERALGIELTICPDQCLKFVVFWIVNPTKLFVTRTVWP